MDPKLETVELDSDNSIRTLHYKCDAFQRNHAWHYHPECELSYIVSGAGTRFIGDSVEHFKAGDMVFIGPNIPHCWISDKGESQNEMLVLQFSPYCLGEAFLKAPEASPLQSLLHEAKRGFRILGNDIADTKIQLENIESTTGLARLSNFIQLLDVLCQTEDRSYLTSELYMADNTEFHGGRLNKVINYVKQNLSEDIKQTDAAKIACMTPQSFSRFFRATTGRTFISFLNILRISEACRLLANSDDDIVKIAFECGYANLSNFNRRFSEIKKTTPTEYRKKHHV